jgi:hypothetical protein
VPNVGNLRPVASILAIVTPLFVSGLFCSVTSGARVILSEDFESDAPDTFPASADFYARSVVGFVNPNTEPAKIVVSGGTFPDPFAPDNKSLVFHNPNSAAQMAVTWTSVFDDDPTGFRNGSIEFDLWMDKPLPSLGSPGGKFWSFLDARIGYGDADRTGVTTNGDLTVWNNIRIQNVFGQSEPVESVVDAGAQFTVGLQTTYTDPAPGLMGPDLSFRVRIEFDGTVGSETSTVYLNETPITWLQDGATAHSWVPGAPGVNVISFLTDASAFFSGGASNVYLDNLVVTNYDLSPLGNGDYNGDSRVDGADFLMWQTALGTAVTPGTGADGNGNGVVDAADLAVWQNNFGAGAAASNFATIPEPHALGLTLLGVAVLLASRRHFTGEALANAQLL